MALAQQGPKDAPVTTGRRGDVAVSARERILHTALDLFTVLGYEGTSLRAISDRLGVTKAALYYHFRAKDDLLQHLLGSVVSAVEAVAAGETPAARAGRGVVLAAYLDAIAGAPGATALLLRDASVGAHPLGQRFRDARERVRAGLVEGNGVDALVRSTAALRAVELVVMDLAEERSPEVKATALDVALSALNSDQ